MGGRKKREDEEQGGRAEGREGSRAGAGEGRGIEYAQQLRLTPPLVMSVLGSPGPSASCTLLASGLRSPAGGTRG